MTFVPSWFEGRRLGLALQRADVSLLRSATPDRAVAWWRVPESRVEVLIESDAAGVAWLLVTVGERCLTWERSPRGTLRSGATNGLVVERDAAAGTVRVHDADKDDPMIQFALTLLQADTTDPVRAQAAEHVRAAGMWLDQPHH